MPPAVIEREAIAGVAAATAALSHEICALCGGQGDPAATSDLPAGGNATDVYRALAIACLTGLFARRAMDKLREVFFTLFEATERREAKPGARPESGRSGKDT